LKALKILAFVLAGGEGTRLHPQLRREAGAAHAVARQSGPRLLFDGKLPVTDSGIVIVSKGRHRLDDTHYY